MLCLQKKCRARKRSESHHNLINTSKMSSPILFHNVKVDEITKGFNTDRTALGYQAFGDDGSRNVQTPLVIKTDPKYNNSQMEISVSSKKLSDFTSSKNRKLKFVPSISNQLPLRDLESKRGQVSGIMGTKSANESRTLKDDLFQVQSSPSVEEYTTEHLNGGSEERSSIEMVGNKPRNLSFFGRKFSSDARLKPNKKNAQLQPIQGYSTCTFRVKINGQHKTRA